MSTNVIHVNSHRLVEVQDGMNCLDCRLTRDDDVAFDFFKCFRYEDAVIPGGFAELKLTPLVSASDAVSRLVELEKRLDEAHAAMKSQERKHKSGGFTPSELCIIVLALNTLDQFQASHRATRAEVAPIINKIFTVMQNAEK